MFLRKKGLLWLIAADGRRARIFAQPDRAAPLALVVERTAPVNGGNPADRPYRVHDVFGRRHSLAETSDPKAAREARFLADIAAQIEASAGKGDFEHLVLAAPPKAMGVLREKLGAGAKARLRAEFPSDVSDKTEHEMAAWLAEAEPPRRRGAHRAAAD